MTPGTSEPGPSRATPQLRCLRGAAPPADLTSSLLALAAFPLEARRRFWTVLGPSLAEPIDASSEEAARAFCDRHDVAPAALSRAVRACRFLLRAAARADVTIDAFDADLTALLPPGPAADDPATHGSTALRQLLRAGFPQAMASLRREILLGSLADHGCVLRKVDWRVDRLLASERGELGVQVAVLTLHLQEGPSHKRLTVQLLPEEVVALKDLLARLVP